MSKKTWLILAALVVAAFSQNAFAAASEYVYLTDLTGTTFLPSTIYSGDIVSIAVDVKNKGNFTPIVNMNASLDIGNQFEAVDLNDSISLINAGSTKTLVFKIQVKNDTLPGYYPVFLIMDYTNNDKQTRETHTILVPVSKTEKSLDITVEPKVINPGNQTEATFTIANTGTTPVSNISFSWAEAGNLVLPVGSDNIRYINSIDAGKSAKVTYTIAADPNIAPGIYPLKATLSFAGVDGTKTQESDIGIIIGGKTDFEISAEITAAGQLSISIANIGSNNAQAVVVRIPRGQGIAISGSDTAILGNLNKGDFTLANFTTISRGFSQETTNSAGMQGQSFTDMHGTQQNQGTQEPQQTGSQNQPAGTQGTGAAFQRRNPGTLELEIDYTDTTGERQAVKKTVNLNLDTAGGTAAGTGTAGTFAQRRGAGSNNLLPWILLALVAGGAAAFNKFKAGNANWKQLGKFLAASVALFLMAIFVFNSELLWVAIAAAASIALLVFHFRKQAGDKQ
ncbi:MAG: hypothetical protein HY394_04120 [Candidatus Diapherotrites archaeon]|nr:hypothetical protein [Candidatus Diapherotrites archaeon]